MAAALLSLYFTPLSPPCRLLIEKLDVWRDWLAGEMEANEECVKEDDKCWRCPGECLSVSCWNGFGELDGCWSDI